MHSYNSQYDHQRNEEDDRRSGSSRRGGVRDSEADRDQYGRRQERDDLWPSRMDSDYEFEQRRDDDRGSQDPYSSGGYRNVQNAGSSYRDENQPRHDQSYGERGSRQQRQQFGDSQYGSKQRGGASSGGSQSSTSGGPEYGDPYGRNQWRYGQEQSYGQGQSGANAGQQYSSGQNRADTGQQSGGRYSGGSTGRWSSYDQGSEQQFSGGAGSAAQRQGQSFRGYGPQNYTRSDERLTEEINDRLTNDHDTDARQIEVKVSKGVVTLTGRVSERMMKYRAEEIAEEIPGVKEVDNQIKVTAKTENQQERSNSAQSERSASSSTGTEHEHNKARSSGSSTNKT